MSLALIIGGAGPVDVDALENYPLSADDRLDSHYFLPWERRRWLNSDMRLRGTPECRALYFDLICISFDQSPVGTLPDDAVSLSRLLMIDREHFLALSRLEFGPLHNWRRCRCGGEIRLMHPTVLKTLNEAIARKLDNQARNEAANEAKRLMRLRVQIAGYHVELAKNDAAIRWMDAWLKENTSRREPKWLEQAIGAWSDHALRLGLMRRDQRKD